VHEVGTLNSRGEIDPSKGVLITCLGKKRSGKSKMALLWFESYPYDRVVIDVNGTDGPHKEVIELHGTVDDLPAKWPEHLREDGKRMTLRYHPDAGSPTVLEDVDAVVGMAYRTGRVCILIHEMGLIAKAGKTPPHVLRVLQSNRHRQITGIFCAPRPITMDVLVLAQSDLVYIFELPNRKDRERVAENIGWESSDFHDAVHELGPHEYLRADTNETRPVEGEPDLRLVHVEALPREVVARLDRL
jgi:hypothetical protein